jgi:hypothetical protein
MAAIKPKRTASADLGRRIAGATAGMVPAAIVAPLEPVAEPEPIATPEPVAPLALVPPEPARVGRPATGKRALDGDGLPVAHFNFRCSDSMGRELSRLALQAGGLRPYLARLMRDAGAEGVTAWDLETAAATGSRWK